MLELPLITIFEGSAMSERALLTTYHHRKTSACHTSFLPSTVHALKKTGMSIDDMDVIEINEAFASVVLAWQKETGADLEKVNVNGGAISLGHPLGATGARLMTTLLCELERTGGRFGLQTMCEGGGQANVTILERLS